MRLQLGGTHEWLPGHARTFSRMLNACLTLPARQASAHLACLPSHSTAAESPIAGGQAYGGGDGTGAEPREFSNAMFRGEGILDSHQVR